mgnify:CR=1 FL=1
METKKIDIILSYYEDNGFKYFYWSLYFSILVLLIINLIYYELTPSFTKIIFGISLLLLTIISIVFNIIIKNHTLLLFFFLLWFGLGQFCTAIDFDFRDGRFKSRGAGIGHFGLIHIQIFQRWQTGQVSQSSIGDGGLFEVKASQAFQSGDLSQPGVGDLRSSQVQSADVGRIFQDRQRFIGHFLIR